jgi:shikimate kinase
LKNISGKNLVLIGFMGTGKTEVGRLLAESLNRRLIDTDQVIVEREGQSVKDIFASSGETYFRQKEQELIQELSVRKGLVIATGGGIVLNTENVNLLRESGYVVWLDADGDTLADRLSGDTERPLLAGGADLAALYREREALYREAAHVRVDTTEKAPLVVVSEIIRVIS